MNRAELSRLAIVSVPGLALVMAVAALVAVLADGGDGADDSGSPKIGDHRHAPYAIFILGVRLSAIPEVVTAEGVHTHGDGIIHIHPFIASAEGKGASLSNFFAGMGGKLTDAELRVPGDRTTYRDRTMVGGELRDGVIVNAEQADVRILRADSGIHPLGSSFADAIGTCNAKPEPEFEEVSADYVPQDGDCIRIVFGPAKK